MKIHFELTKLACLLAKADIPFELVAWTLCDEPTIQIAAPNKANCVIDAVCHAHSYGGNAGLLEIMGPDVDECDDVLGWLSAEEAFEHFKRVMKPGEH
jgi:hypothetical protein